jgi:hypothetical protein
MLVMLWDLEDKAQCLKVSMARSSHKDSIKAWWSAYSLNDSHSLTFKELPLLTCRLHRVKFSISNELAETKVRLDATA